jgi:hypothetical protein
MSQWGAARTFIGENYTIRVLADAWTGGAFNPIGNAARVADLFLMDIKGDEQAARARFAELRAEYKDRPYSAWERRVSERRKNQ